MREPAMKRTDESEVGGLQEDEKRRSLRHYVALRTHAKLSAPELRFLTLISVCGTTRASGGTGNIS